MRHSRCTVAVERPVAAAICPLRRLRARLARSVCMSDWGLLANTGKGEAAARARCGSAAPLLPEFTCRRRDERL